MKVKAQKSFKKFPFIEYKFQFNEGYFKQAQLLLF